MNQIIKDNLNIIRKVAWQFVPKKDHNQDLDMVDDLVQEGCLCLLKKYKHFNKEKAKISTYIYHICLNRFKDIKKREREKAYNDMRVMLDESGKNDIDPFYSAAFKDAVTKLSKESQEIIKVIIENPSIFLKIPENKSSRYAIKKYLELQGWSYRKIHKKFREINMFMDEY